jgi:hypothetical protein
MIFCFRQNFVNLFPQNGNRPVVGPILPLLFPWLFGALNKEDEKDRLEDQVITVLFLQNRYKMVGKLRRSQ